MTFKWPPTDTSILMSEFIIIELIEITMSRASKNTGHVSIIIEYHLMYFVIVIAVLHSMAIGGMQCDNVTF